MKKGHIIFATLRAIYLSLIVVLKRYNFDVIFCDQISVYVLIIKLFTSSKIVFYCHHPDKVLTTNHNLINRMYLLIYNSYRIPFDLFEEFTTKLSDILLTNSEYSKSVIRKSFKCFMSQNDPVMVLYPSLNTSFLDKIIKENKQKGIKRDDEYITFFSINRYERKKNIKMAILGFIEVINRMNENNHKHKIKLVIAGGYDHLLLENIEHYKELIQLLKDKFV